MGREGPSGKVTFNLKPKEWEGASYGLNQENSLSRQWSRKYKVLIEERVCWGHWKGERNILLEKSRAEGGMGVQEVSLER